MCNGRDKSVPTIFRSAIVKPNGYQISNITIEETMRRTSCCYECDVIGECEDVETTAFKDIGATGHAMK